jgi:hypothetical protein
MIRRRVRDVIECFARDRDHMRLANFELFGRFETERKALRGPIKNCLPNLTPLLANGNSGMDFPTVDSSLGQSMALAVAVPHPTWITRTVIRTIRMAVVPANEMIRLAQNYLGSARS